MNIKPFWKSKLFWLGVIQIAIGVLNFVEGQLNNGGMITVMGLLTVILRTVTNSKIKWALK